MRSWTGSNGPEGKGRETHLAHLLALFSAEEDVKDRLEARGLDGVLLALGGRVDAKGLGDALDCKTTYKGQLSSARSRGLIRKPCSERGPCMAPRRGEEGGRRTGNLEPLDVVRLDAAVRDGLLEEVEHVPDKCLLVLIGHGEEIRWRGDLGVGVAGEQGPSSGPKGVSLARLIYRLRLPSMGPISTFACAFAHTPWQRRSGIHGERRSVS